MSRVVIIPYKMQSASSSVLAGAIRELRVDCVRVNRTSNTFRARPEDIVINWGGGTAFNEHISNQLELNNTRILNHPVHVALSSNKLNTLRVLNGNVIPIPPYTTSREEANAWLAGGDMVVQRGLLNSHSGGGIELFYPEEDHEVGVAPLYTMYIKKRNEYRVHLLPDGGFDVQEKKRRADSNLDNYQSRIRSHDNGWVFCRDNLNLDNEKLERLLHVSRESLRVLNLNFGAVDVIYNSRRNNFYVLEVNTAVGLTGHTLSKYANSFARLAGAFVPQV